MTRRVEPVARPHVSVASQFTLIELLVVVAIISVLAAMLLPALAKARSQALHTLCISQLKQNGIAMLTYQNEFDDYFPNFGGVVADIGYGRTGSPQLYLNKFHATGGGQTFFTSYLGQKIGTPQTTHAKMAYCPGRDWSQAGFYLPDNPSNLRFTNAMPNGALGYFYYVGRKMYGSTHSNADTLQRRFDPGELLMTDFIGHSDRDETGGSGASAYQRVYGWKLNPHEGADCRPVLTNNMHELAADGSTSTWKAQTATATLAWGTYNFAHTLAVGPSNTLEDGRWYKVKGY